MISAIFEQFVFCMAIVAFNILSTVKTALKSVHGIGKINAGLSDCYLAEEVQATFRGMASALPAPLWWHYLQMSDSEFALTLKQWAGKVNLKRFSFSPKGQKRPKKNQLMTLSILMSLLPAFYNRKISTYAHLNGGSS